MLDADQATRLGMQEARIDVETANANDTTPGSCNGATKDGTTLKNSELGQAIAGRSNHLVYDQEPHLVSE